MAFTDHSDLFGSVHEDAFNILIHHVMEQRPSLFNYATAAFHQHPEWFCHKIEPAQPVQDAGNPLFTEQKPLPILATPFPVGINFCIQLTDVEIDLHSSNRFNLPTELGDLPEQHFALRAKACAGIDCPRKDIIDELLPVIEQVLVAQQDLAISEIDEFKEDEDKPGKTASSTRRAAVTHSNVNVLAPPDRPLGFDLPQDTVVLPTRELICFCLELYVVGHFEWGTVTGSQQQWLKPKVDGIEIVEIEPTAMENAIECYLTTVLKLGIMPRLMIPMEKLILDITAILKEQGLNIGQQVSLVPAAVPADVPHNPSVEKDQISAFVNLSIS